MGCQCAKANEPSNVNLETAPPKSEEFVSEAPKVETVNHSKIDNSQVDDSKMGKKKKKVTKKKQGKLKFFFSIYLT